jgi:hypothetical protein
MNKYQFPLGLLVGGLAMLATTGFAQDPLDGPLPTFEEVGPEFEGPFLDTEEEVVRPAECPPCPPCQMPHKVDQQKVKQAMEAIEAYERREEQMQMQVEPVFPEE